MMGVCMFSHHVTVPSDVNVICPLLLLEAKLHHIWKAYLTEDLLVELAKLQRG